MRPFATKSKLNYLSLLFFVFTNLSCTPAEVIELNSELFVALCTDPAEFDRMFTAPEYQQNIDVNMAYSKGPIPCGESQVVPGDTLLIAATKTGNLAVMSSILGFSNVDVNKQDGSGNTVLHWAVSKCATDAITLLGNHSNLDSSIVPTLKTSAFRSQCDQTVHDALDSLNDQQNS